MTIRRVRVTIAGRVQGVFFRASARDQADKLGVSGWAQNLADGRVEVVAEGEAQKIARFLDWCRRGPLLARVDDCHVVEEAPLGESGGFEVRR